MAHETQGTELGFSFRPDEILRTEFMTPADLEYSDQNLAAEIRKLSFSGYERNVLFINQGGTFVETGFAFGLDRLEDGRSVAYADFDRDGDLDFVLRNLTGPAVLYLRNEVGQDNNAVLVKLRGRKSNSQGIGARVTARTGDLEQTREIRAGSGYLSQSSALAHFGIGARKNIDKLIVRWPSGVEQTFVNLPVQHEIVVTEGDRDLRLLPLKRRTTEDR